MKWNHLVVLAALLSASVCFAQTEFSPPPMVPSGQPPPPPPPEPPPAGVAPAQPGTPPPPSALPPNGYVPGGGQYGSGYPYSPYGTPMKPNEKPPMEVGLMISESLFGMLTAAGITLIPYFLLFNSSNAAGALGDPGVTSAVFVVIFAATPLAVAQTETSLANGSRYYYTETWPAALAGLAGEAAVLGLYYLTGWLPSDPGGLGTPKAGGSLLLLMIGSIAFVPLLEMAAVNLFKSPRVARWGGLLTFDHEHGLALGVPSLTPAVGETKMGLAYGAQLNVVDMRF